MQTLQREVTFLPFWMGCANQILLQDGLFASSLLTDMVVSGRDCFLQSLTWLISFMFSERLQSWIYLVYIHMMFFLLNHAKLRSKWVFWWTKVVILTFLLKRSSNVTQVSDLQTPNIRKMQRKNLSPSQIGGRKYRKWKIEQNLNQQYTNLGERKKWNKNCLPQNLDVTPSCLVGKTVRWIKKVRAP